MPKTQTIRPEPVMLKAKLYAPTVKQFPGDTTISFVLAFFAVVEAPILTVIVYICDYYHLASLAATLCIFAATFISTYLFLFTSLGIKTVMWVVKHVKKVEMK